MPTLDMFSSPLDRDQAGAGQTPLVQLEYATKSRSAQWRPSRFNARTVGADGRVILWNTFSGAVTVFGAKNSEAVLQCLSSNGVPEPLGRIGSYLRDRGYLVHQGDDEVERFRYYYARDQWRSDILELHLLASEDCNFRCVYCYEKFKRGTMLQGVRDGVRNLVLKRARHLKRLGISWFGGEPLYGWDAIEDLGPFFSHIGHQYELDFSASMTTNGFLLTDDRAGKLLSWGCNSFQISIDGLPKEHDCKRIGRDGSPTYAVILDNLRALRRRRERFGVSIRVNFDKANVDKLGGFLATLRRDFGGDRRFRLRFYPVGKWGGANDDRLEVCGTDERRQALENLRRMALDANLDTHGGILDIAKPGSQVCYAARPYNFIVGASGQLMKCTIALDENKENIVGILHPDGTMEIDDRRLGKWVKAHWETDSLCKKCHLLPACQGAACPLTRIQRGERTCSGIKSALKPEMRFTLARAASQ